MYNKILSDAKKFISDSNFEDAISSFYNLAYDERATQLDRTTAFVELINLHNLVDSDIKVVAECIYDFARMLFGFQDYFYAKEKFEQLLTQLAKDEQLFGRCVEFIFECSFALKLAKKIQHEAEEYLEYLLVKRKYDKGLLVIDKIDKGGYESSGFDNYKIVFFAGKEQFGKVEEMLFESEEVPLFWSLIEKEIVKAGAEEMYRPSFIYCAVKTRLKKIESFKDVGNGYIFKLSYEMYRYLFEGSIYFPNNTRLLSLCEDVIEYEKLEGCLSGQNRFEVNETEEIDKIDENENGENNVKTQGVVAQVLEEFLDGRHTYDANDIALEKYICHMDREELTKYFKDIIVALFMQESYLALFKTIEIAERNITTLEEKSLLEYFKIVAQYRSGNYYEAISLIDFACGSLVVNEFATMNLMYIKAEIYKIMGETEKALKIYKEIKAVKDHRLVKQRISEIEGN